MPSEALQRRYRWLPRDAVTRGDDLWFHNPIHDVESLWWVAVWSVLFFTLESADPPPDAQRRFELLFPNQEQTERYGFIADSGSVLLYHASSFPPFNFALARPIDRWMVSIIKSYQKYELEYPPNLDDSAFHDIHSQADAYTQEVFNVMEQIEGSANESIKRTWK